MAKFKVGDRARFIVRNPNASQRRLPIGSVVTICDVDILSKTKTGVERLDYKVEFSGYTPCVYEWQLEPIIELGDSSQREGNVPLGDWDELQKTINWNPTKESTHVE